MPEQDAFDLSRRCAERAEDREFSAAHEQVVPGQAEHDVTRGGVM